MGTTGGATALPFWPRTKANAKAKADSERGGTANLVGTQLFREFREVSPKVWKGKVFVPDLNKVFTGTGTIKEENTVVARAASSGISAARRKPGSELIEVPRQGGANQVGQLMSAMGKSGHLARAWGVLPVELHYSFYWMPQLNGREIHATK